MEPVTLEKYHSTALPAHAANADARPVDILRNGRETNENSLPPLHLAPRSRKDFNQVLHYYISTDALALVLGAVGAWGIAVLYNSVFYSREIMHPAHDSMRVMQFLLLGLGILLWFQHTEHYRVRMPFWLEVKKVVSTLGFAMLTDGFLHFASKQDFSRLWLMSGWVIAAVAILSFRALVRAWLWRKGRFQVRTLLVGDGPTAQHVRSALKSERGLGYVIASQLKNLPAAFLLSGCSWEALCERYNVDYVVIALDGKDLNAAEQPLAQLMRENIPFSITPPLRHLPVLGMVPQYFFNHDVMLLTRSSGLEQPLPRLVKRMVDITISGTALLVLSPLMLTVALLVRRDGGPALYGHKRLGLNGKSFSCLKFRSMVMNGDDVLQRYLKENPEAHEEWATTRKLQNDPRVTRIGAFLRKSSLDELPQLINVLRGDMSLVGPRPIVTAEVSNYDYDIAHYYRVRPGITGLWQVSGRNDVTYRQRVQMDSWYVRNWSLWHDIAIICKTFPAVLRRSGAY
jgi:undecaprenyl-phosphate galactose phosphotransferase